MSRRLARTAPPILGGLIISAVTALVYRGILWPAAGVALPWSSDALGHVLKAEYLWAHLLAGNPYPDFFPGWYMGIQMLRYYPPLPYYLLAGLVAVAGPMAAVSWMVVAGARGHQAPAIDPLILANLHEVVHPSNPQTIREDERD